MELSKIQSNGSWGEAADSLNQNFQKVNNAVEQVKNATTRNKGYFSSDAELKSAFPTANVGDVAYVGSAYPYQTWNWNGSAWVKKNNSGGDESVNLGNYYTKEETDGKFDEADAKLSELGQKQSFSDYLMLVPNDTTIPVLNTKNQTLTLKSGSWFLGVPGVSVQLTEDIVVTKPTEADGSRYGSHYVVINEESKEVRLVGTDRQVNLIKGKEGVICLVRWTSVVVKSGFFKYSLNGTIIKPVPTMDVEEELKTLKKETDELGPNLRSLPIDISEDEKLEVVDINGNIAFSIDGSGVKSKKASFDEIEATDESGNKPLAINKRGVKSTLIESKEVLSEDDDLQIADKDGNMALLIDKYGSKIKRIDLEELLSNADGIEIIDKNGNIAFSVDGRGVKFTPNVLGDSVLLESYMIDNHIIRYNTSMSLVGMIKSWGFIGGSTTSGEAEYTKEDGSVGYDDLYEYSIGQQLCKINGVEGYNFSQGGQSAYGWCSGTTPRTWEGAKNFENLKQAYIIDLGANDLRMNIPLGSLQTDVDLTNYNNNANTIVGWYVGVIQRLRSVNPKCYIFLLTSRNYMYPNSGEYVKKIIPMIYDVYDYLKSNGFERIYIVDNNKLGIQHGTAYQNVLMSGGHPSTIGYHLEGYVVNTLIDQVIRQNLADFKEVGFVLTDKARK